MQGYRKAFWAVAFLLVAGLILLVGFEITVHRLPISVGTTADEAWDYFHSSAAWESRSPLIEVERISAKAHALDIHSDLRYSLRWPTHRVVATRHVVYRLDTNSTIVSITSKWKWIRPF